MSIPKTTQVRFGHAAGATEAVELDLAKFLRSRALIESNSGGGKSYLIRRLTEVLFHYVPIIIFDLEGEFLTLRDKYPFLVGGIGDGYDFVTDPASAATLARKILELRASVILDLSEVKKENRSPFVKHFLESFVDSNKKLWTPYVVIVDEAHHFAPQASAKESESLAAVVDLVTRGRKRGFCGVLATQRISKIHKDATAELLNKFIGRTSQDIDMKRAGDELGFRTDADEKSLRDLEEGEFFVFGPAISKAVQKVKIDKVVTHHPEVGEDIRSLKPIAPTPKIKAMLQKLSDVPAQARQELHDVQSLKAELHKRDHEIRQLKTQQGKPKEVLKTVVDKAAVRESYEFGMKRGFVQGMHELARAIPSALKKIVDDAITKSTKSAAFIAPVGPPVAPRVRRDLVESTYDDDRRKRAEALANAETDLVAGEEVKLAAGPKRILTYLAQYYPNRLTRGQVGGYTGYASTGGTFQNYLSQLKKVGFIDESSEGLRATDEGRGSLGDIPAAPRSVEEVFDMWEKKLPAGPRKMFTILFNVWQQQEDKITREALAEQSGFTASGGTFSNYLSLLRRNKLIVEKGGFVSLNEEIIPS